VVEGQAERQQRDQRDREDEGAGVREERQPEERDQEREDLRTGEIAIARDRQREDGERRPLSEEIGVEAPPEELIGGRGEGVAEGRDQRGGVGEAATAEEIEDQEGRRRIDERREEPERQRGIAIEGAGNRREWGHQRVEGGRVGGALVAPFAADHGEEEVAAQDVFHAVGLEDQIVGGEAGIEDAREVRERAEGEDPGEPAFLAQVEDHAAARVEPADGRTEDEGGDDRRDEDQQEVEDVRGGDVGFANLTDDQPGDQREECHRRANDRRAEIAEESGQADQQDEHRDGIGGGGRCTAHRRYRAPG